jgi:UDP-N-acetylmuramoylalanine--D-glutamate ligase
VGELDGVLFVDDSLSTNVLPTLAAVDAFPGRRVAILVGGQDRGIDYVPLAEGLAARPDPTLAVVMGSEVAPRLRAALAAAAGTVEVTEGEDLDTATRTAYEWARPDGVVLLSPAAPSFDRYRDYRARSAAFNAALTRLLRR